MTSHEDIEQQQRLLVAHRATLAVYLERLARQGLAHVAPEVIHGIHEARLHIRHIKAMLRDWNITVEDHPDDEALSLQNNDFRDGPLATVWPANIPDDRYYSLPRRDRQLQDMVNAFTAPNRAKLVVITGLGGLGKTAVAAEVARRLLEQQQVEGVIGDSAKEQLFAGDEIVPLHHATLDFNTLIDTIGRQLGRWEIPTLNPAEKRAALGRLFQQHRYLILVDNLETVENAQSLVAELRTYLGQSQAIVTSRERVVDESARPFTLSALEVDDSLSFIRADAMQRGVDQLIAASEALLLDIHHITGGAPLALKLIVAQARFFDIQLVIDQLRHTGTKLYTYIYRRAWQQLSPAAQRALIYIGQTVVTTVGWNELDAVAIAASEEELMRAIDQLIAYSLLNVVPANGPIRYGIHQLTRHFVKSGLPELWQEQGLV